MQVAQHDFPVNMLRKQVGRVLRARDFSQLEIAFAHTVLNPEIRHMEVPDLTKAPASADADGRRGIGKHIDTELKPQLCSNTPKAEGLGGTSADTAQFSSRR